ncbi:MAG: hypothetical protein ACK4GO_16820 [Gemmobacter sp.]
MGIPTIALGLQAAGSIFGGVSAYQSAKAEKEAAEVNAFIGRTRAMQTDAASRQGLNSELGTLRATFAANSQRPGVGTMEINRDLRSVRAGDRRVEFGNRMQEAAGFRTAGRNARSRARSDLLGGFIKAGPSMLQIYSMHRRT